MILELITLNLYGQLKICDGYTLTYDYVGDVPTDTVVVYGRQEVEAELKALGVTPRELTRLSRK